MSGDKRTLRWCAEHQQPAWVYDDGSEWCWYDSIVEATNPHKIVNLPQDDEIERLQEQVRWASDRASEWKLETYQLNSEIERLRAVGDALVDAVERQQWSTVDVAVAAWKEASRER